MIPALVNNPLFRGITPERLFADLEEISFHTRSYKKGEILAQQGAVCNRLVILTKGSVRGEMIDYSGRLIKVEDIAAPRAIRGGDPLSGGSDCQRTDRGYRTS